jgi:hypothetical protein
MTLRLIGRTQKARICRSLYIVGWESIDYHNLSPLLNPMAAPAEATDWLRMGRLRAHAL